MSLTSKAISNTAYLTLQWIFTTIFSFLFWFVMTKNLPLEYYGIVSTSVNLMLILGSISMVGLDTAISKLIPEYSKKNKEKIRNLITFSTKIISITNLILFLIMILFSSFFATVLKVSQGTVWLIIIGFIAFSSFNFTTSILYGHQNMKNVFQTKVLGDITKFLLSSILILVGVYYSISTFPFGYYGPLIGTILGFLIISLLRYKLFMFKKNGNNHLDKGNIIFKYSLPAFIGMIALLIFNNVPYIILTIIKNPDITGLFSVASTVLSPVSLIPNILISASFPIISQLCVVKDAKKRQAYFINSLLRYCLFLILPFATFLILFSRELILLFAKSDYLSSITLFPILGSAMIIYCFGEIFISNLYAIRKTKINRNIRIITAVLFLILSIPFTYFFSAYGLSIAYFISLFISMLFSYIFLIKYLPIKFPLKDLSKILISTLIFLFINYVSRLIFDNVIIKFFVAFLTGILYLLTFIPLKFYKKNDIELLKVIYKKSPKLLRSYIIFLIEFLSKFI